MIIQIKKSVFKEVSKLPRRIQILYGEFLSDLEKDGLNIQGWDLIKLSGSTNECRIKNSETIKQEGRFKVD